MNLLSGFIDLVPVGLMQGLTYALIAIAIMIPFRILNFADMTGEGAFPFGACVCAKLLMSCHRSSAIVLTMLIGSRHASGRGPRFRNAMLASPERSNS